VQARTGFDAGHVAAGLSARGVPRIPQAG
jgi:hypothetical protein